MVPPPARLAVAGKQLTGMPGRYANGGDSANGGGSEEGEKTGDHEAEGDEAWERGAPDSARCRPTL